jgi:hypothetical protein
MWVISPTINLVLVILIQPLDTSSGEAGGTQMRNMTAEFSCCKSTTWDRQLYFPSKGKHAMDFITLKIHRPRPGLNPRTLGPVASTLTTRPPRATYTYTLGINMKGVVSNFWRCVTLAFIPFTYMSESRMNNRFPPPPLYHAITKSCLSVCIHQHTTSVFTSSYLKCFSP